VEQALRLVRREFGPTTVVELDYPEILPELCLPKNRVAQVLTNLLLNAAHATREVERDMHRVRVSVRVDEEALALSVADSGPGIPEAVLEQIFDPFFTTKKSEKGTGLGLSISRSIIKPLGGELLVSSLEGEGATFVCVLPLPSKVALESTRRSIRRTSTLPPARSLPTVLLVDDDARLLRVVSRIVKHHFKVLLARDGAEAIEIIESGSTPDAIVSELALPEIEGPDFYEWLRLSRPTLLERIIFLTGAQERKDFAQFLRDHPLRVLHKPPSAQSLLRALRDVAAKVPTLSPEGSLSGRGERKNANA
jgi:two-component system NtrC family sensor kinase